MGNNGKKADDKARAMANWKLLKNASPASKKAIRKILNNERLAKEATKKKDKELIARKSQKKVKSPHS